MSGFVAIGRVVKPQGRKGELLVEPLSDREGRFPALKRVLVAGAGAEARELVGIPGRDVGVERIEIGIGVPADGLATAAEMQHRRRRDRHLGRARRHRAQEFEVGALNRPRMADLSGHLHHRRLEIDVAFRAVEFDVNAALRLHALELRQEIDVEIRAPILAVGDAAQAQVFLELDDAADRLVLDGSKPRGVDRAGA